MALQEKYAELIQAAKTGGISNLQVREQGNVLYIDGSTSSGALKDSLWDIYNKIDPDYRAGDLILNIDASAATGTQAKVSTESSNLNIRKGPGTDQPIVGKAAHNAIVTVISRANDQWSLVRTDKGEEGYAYSQYLTQV
ncbi:SH3 domain-containing protein [Mucilaginibacter gilvus]|uniref:SH3 domain-containing protein n=1 Tax=Mucilaginibacter gilvus TaxID=2305909 RepID=A0A3S4YKA6_9SPHI|nr:SH3 domain-containing protein [Mucilaginibacter gilvus]RWY57052.1 SH3 domain-containing protein [Mucilaginibacter gilvus]